MSRASVLARWYPVNFDNGRWRYAGRRPEFLSPLESGALAEKNHRQGSAFERFDTTPGRARSAGAGGPREVQFLRCRSTQLVFSILQTLGLEVGTTIETSLGHRPGPLAWLGWGEVRAGKGRRPRGLHAAGGTGARGWPQAGWLKVQTGRVGGNLGVARAFH